MNLRATRRETLANPYVDKGSITRRFFISLELPPSNCRNDNSIKTRYQQQILQSTQSVEIFASFFRFPAPASKLPSASDWGTLLIEVTNQKASWPAARGADFATTPPTRRLPIERFETRLGAMKSMALLIRSTIVTPADLWSPNPTLSNLARD
jgi:hypothetical protein